MWIRAAAWEEETWLKIRHGVEVFLVFFICLLAVMFPVQQQHMSNTGRMKKQQEFF